MTKTTQHSWPALVSNVELHVRFALEKVSLFAGHMSTCLSTGMGVPESLKLAGRSVCAPHQQHLMDAAIKRSKSGMALHESLQPLASRLPSFFIPVVRCGEESGRTDDVLRYLEEHCRLLVRPTKAMRNTWLYPMVILLAGSVVKLVAYLLIAPLPTALAFAGNMITTYATVAIVLFFVIFVPQVKAPLGRLILTLPVIGAAHRELALNRFFHALNLLYSTGGMRVEQMIKLAAPVVTNLSLREDLMRSSILIEKGGTISEAFQAPAVIDADQRTTIHAGEESGKLDEAFDAISRQTGESVQFRLAGLNQLLLRIVMASVAFSVAATVGSLFVHF